MGGKIVRAVSANVCEFSRAVLMAFESVLGCAKIHAFAASSVSNSVAKLAVDCPEIMALSARIGS